MMRVLIFGGTTEGRLLCETLADWPVQVTVCVATDYGREALSGLPGSVAVHTGRLDQCAMEVLMREGFALAVDATHPYALVASQTILAASRNAKTPCFRFKREASERRDVTYVTSVAEAAVSLAHTEGNILATTGVKELDAYTAIDGYAARVYPRVLPTLESIARCDALGFPKRHIIAMQGPFSRALNQALIRQLDIRWLVTKDGGDFGGFLAKVEAAADCGAGCLVVGRPPEDTGHSMAEILERIQNMLWEGTNAAGHR